MRFNIVFSLVVAILVIVAIAGILHVANAFHFSQSVAGMQEAMERHGPIHVKIWIISIITSGVAAISVAVILASVLAYSRIRKGTARVFVSYHHSQIAIVERIVRTFEKTGITAAYLPFIDNLEHDKLLDNIYRQIEDSQFVICLPGVTPSFVDSEVAVAVSGHKPLFIVLPEPHKGTPNTSQKYYQVLKLSELEARSFVPLARVIAYLHGEVAATIRLYASSWEIPSWAQLVIILFFIPTWLVGFVGVLFINIIAPFFGARYSAYYQFVIIGYIVLPLATSMIIMASVGSVSAMMYSIYKRSRALRIVRREIREGCYSYNALVPLLHNSKLQSVLDCFFKTAPRAHHELA